MEAQAQRAFGGADPVLADFLTVLFAQCDDVLRAKLEARLGQLLGTNGGPELSLGRALAAVRFAVRQIAPPVLRAIGVRDYGLWCDWLDDRESTERVRDTARIAACSAEHVDAERARPVRMIAWALGALMDATAGRELDVGHLAEATWHVAGAAMDAKVPHRVVLDIFELMLEVE